MTTAVRSWMNKRMKGGDALMWELELNRHASGEYSIAVVQANSSLEDQSQVISSPSATYVGVFDGHGGPDASRFVNAHLFRCLLKFVREHGGLSAEVIRMAFNSTEDEFFRLVKQCLPIKPEIASVGSCCLVGAISQNTLYVANLGDSRAVLGRLSDDKKKTLAERLSTDHNVAVEEVRKEVEALHPDDSHIVMFIRGVWRIKGIIQVSRSIGDVYLKRPEFNRDPLFQHLGYHVPLRRPVISSEPSISVRKLKPQDMFVIFASDGLWEQLSDEEAVVIVANHGRTGIARRLARAALKRAARKREMRYSDLKKIEKGVRRNFHDDITVVVVYLDEHHHDRSSSSTTDNAVDTVSPVDIFTLREGHDVQVS